MNEAKRLVAIEGVALSSLIAVALAMAAYGGVSSMQPNALLSPKSGALVGFGYTFVVGAPIVLLLGAPSYWLLLRRQGALQWSSVLGLGAVPGLLLLLVAKDLGFLSIGCGVAIASITHWACSRLALTRASSRRADVRGLS